MDNQTYTFITLFENEIDYDSSRKVNVCQVVIPKIQRPYAQGRNNDVCRYVRDTFLEEMFDSIKDKVFDLNFIYGIVREEGQDYVMELLDGQQRLTTLFLLYWYVANRELDCDSEEYRKVCGCLGRFVYETRSTSTTFCSHLARYRAKDLATLPPSANIKRAKWFFKSFERDSTISGMLTMLDAIHEHYNRTEATGLFPKLGNIQFYVKSLGVYRLSDELYIKMNARGLQLSPFENFKADIIHFISKGLYEEQVPLYKKSGEETVPFSLNFSIKLDAKWIDLFWKESSQKDYDASYMSFFYRFMVCKYIIDSKEEYSDKEMQHNEVVRELFSAREGKDSEYAGFKTFERLLQRNPEHIRELDKVFDTLWEHDFSEAKRRVSSNLTPSWDRNGDGVEAVLYSSKSITQQQLALFSAVIEYMNAYGSFETETFRRWMRVVNNIIENTNVDSMVPTSSLIRKLSEIVRHTSRHKDFYKALALWDAEKESRAVKEEVLKARCISEDAEWEDVFIEAESHPYLKGMVSFFYTPGMSMADYAHRYSIVKEMFDAKGISKPMREQHLLIRAIVCQLKSLHNQYITEKAESQKYLKNILASDEGTRRMFCDVLDSGCLNETKQKLQSYIVDATIQTDSESVAAAFRRLKEDIAVFDWLSDVESDTSKCFRIYDYQGHVTLAIPRNWYNRIILDSERKGIAARLIKEYGFRVCEESEQTFEKYGDFDGFFNPWIYKETPKHTVWVGFLENHAIQVELEFPPESNKENKVLSTDIAHDSEDEAMPLLTEAIRPWI